VQYSPLILFDVIHISGAMNMYFAHFFGAYFPSRCCYLSTLKMCTGGSLDFGLLR